MRTGDTNDLVSAQAIAVILDTAESTVFEWERLGLLARMRERNGQPFYRAADVRRVIVLVGEQVAGDFRQRQADREQPAAPTERSNKPAESLVRLNDTLVRLYGPWGVPVGFAFFVAANLIVDRLVPPRNVPKSNSTTEPHTPTNVSKARAALPSLTASPSRGKSRR